MKKLILKYLTNSISEKELTKLKEWLYNPENQETFKDYIKDDYNLNRLYDTIDADKAFENVWSDIEKHSKVIPFYKKAMFKYAVAASVAAILALPFIFSEKDNNILSDQTPEIATQENAIEAGTNKAILTLDDGIEISLAKNTNYVNSNSKSDGEKLVYNSDKSIVEATTYNYLTVPRGGEYTVELSDGTKVWLNSDSKLKYPIRFNKGETRKVELLYGEAYFDVSSSTNNNGASFKVVMNTQEIEVLGTEFNIKAYKEDNLIETTLIEGEVSVDNHSIKQLLKPGYQTILNKNTQNLVVSEADIKSVTAWKRGLFSFKDKSLKDIMKVMSRWYDVDVIFIDKTLENVKFKGVLSKHQNMEDILTLIKNTNFINAYDLKNNTLIIKN